LQAARDVTEPSERTGALRPLLCGVALADFVVAASRFLRSRPAPAPLRLTKMCANSKR
jgi:hypothetical protein